VVGKIDIQADVHGQSQVEKLTKMPDSQWSMVPKLNTTPRAFDGVWAWLDPLPVVGCNTPCCPTPCTRPGHISNRSREQRATALPFGHSPFDRSYTGIHRRQMSEPTWSVNCSSGHRVQLGWWSEVAKRRLSLNDPVDQPRKGDKLSNGDRSARCLPGRSAF